MVRYFSSKGLRAYEIGDIVQDEDSTVKYTGRLNWD
jgi:hypothetical protein